MSTFDALLDPVIRLAGDAAQAILSVYEKDDFSVQDKGDTSPLTEADLAAHRVDRPGENRSQLRLRLGCFMATPSGHRPR